MKEVTQRPKSESEGNAINTVRIPDHTFNNIFHENTNTSYGEKIELEYSSHYLNNRELSKPPYFTDKALVDMALNKIPDFESLIYELTEIIGSVGNQIGALDFLPVLRKFSLTDPVELYNFIKNPETNHVIIKNEHLKMVLIRWEPGDISKIHGHAIGGCVFKVLHGKIVEKRFSVENKYKLLSESTYHKDHISYIDDIMGLHCVGNPYSNPAVTLHMYTPGDYKPNTL